MSLSNDLLKRLRHHMRVSNINSAELVQALNELDVHLCSGGTLPTEWSTNVGVAVQRALKQEREQAAFVQRLRALDAEQRRAIETFYGRSTEELTDAQIAFWKHRIGASKI